LKKFGFGRFYVEKRDLNQVDVQKTLKMYPQLDITSNK